MMRGLLTACLLAGCASGRTIGDSPDAGADGTDAKTWRDAGVAPRPDSGSMGGPPDAMPQAMCQDQQLLLNPVLDTNPSGMGWIQAPTDTTAPLITSDDGVPEHTAPFKAWLGGLAAFDYGQFTVTDELYQDITIPLKTTKLVLTAQYDVRTGETEPGVYDDALVALVQPNGTQIESVISLTNQTATTAWTGINKTFATPHAGETVRLRVTATNDFVTPTSFFFDSFALTATICP